MNNTVKKKQEQNFSLEAAANVRARLRRFDQNEKKNTLMKLLAIFFTIYPDFISIFQAFSQVWKIPGQISRLFQEFKSMYEPCPKHQTFPRQMLTAGTSRKRPPPVSDRYQFLGLTVL